MPNSIDIRLYADLYRYSPLSRFLSIFTHMPFSIDMHTNMPICIDIHLYADLYRYSTLSRLLSMSCFLCLYCLRAAQLECVPRYQVGIPLFLSSSPKGGGLSFSPAEISIPLSSMAISGLIVQLSPMYKVLARYGPHSTYIWSMCLLVPAVSSVPLVGLLLTGKTLQTLSLVTALVVVGAAESVAYQRYLHDSLT